MNIARFEIRLTPERRRELEDLAREVGLSSKRTGAAWNRLVAGASGRPARAPAEGGERDEAA